MLLLLCSWTNAQRDCSTLSGSFVPLEDLGSSMFMSYQGGQYPAGSNIRPSLQLSRALTQANAIVPLNLSGNIDQSNGKVVMIGVGASNPRAEFTAFKQLCDTFQCLNNKLKIINTCKGGTGIQKMNYDTAAYWSLAADTLLSYGLSSLQVQVIWIEQEHTGSTNTVFPSSPLQLVNEYKKLLEVILIKYPNVKIAYINSRAYAGYSDNTSGPGLSHPRDYYNSWAIKWLIENQINNVSGFNYISPNINIPFVDWATNSWANGNIPKQDGFFWDCVNDFGAADGLHLSTIGEKKVGLRLFNYFSKDTTSKIWFTYALCNSGSTGIGKLNSFNDAVVLFPNPTASGSINIQSSRNFMYKIYNGLGELVKDGVHTNMNTLIDVSEFRKGIYMIRSSDAPFFSKRIVIN